MHWRLTNLSESLDRAKGASSRRTSKVKKHPLTKAPFSQARGPEKFEKKKFVFNFGPLFATAVVFTIHADSLSFFPQNASTLLSR